MAYAADVNLLGEDIYKNFRSTEAVLDCSKTDVAVNVN
jgi:hypothetical protein